MKKFCKAALACVLMSALTIVAIPATGAFAESTSAPQNNDNPLIWVAVALGIIACIAAILLLLLRKKEGTVFGKKEVPSADKADAETDVQPQDDATDGENRAVDEQNVETDEADKVNGNETKAANQDK